MKRGFTLMEVNLAVFIMAMGVMSMVVLYPLGFRENRQSREDVAATAVADAVLNPLVAALSSTELTWNDWTSILGDQPDGCSPQQGWRAYCNDDYVVTRSSLGSQASAVIGKIRSKCSNAPVVPASGSKDVGGMYYALVATYGPFVDESGVLANHDRSRICLSLRATRRPGQLLSQPIFYTEVHFQGKPR